MMVNGNGGVTMCSLSFFLHTAICLFPKPLHLDGQPGLVHPRSFGFIFLFFSFGLAFRLCCMPYHLALPSSRPRAPSIFALFRRYSFTPPERLFHTIIVSRSQTRQLEKSKMKGRIKFVLKHTVLNEASSMPFLRPFRKAQ